MLRVFFVSGFFAAYFGAAAVQESIAQQPSKMTERSKASAAVQPDPIQTPAAELKLRLVPLHVEDLTAVRDVVIAELARTAEELVDQLVERQRLDEAAEKDPEASADLDEMLTELAQTKADLVRRANLVLAAIEAKGGDVAVHRGYVAAINELRAVEPAPVDKPDERSPEERKGALLQSRVAELIGVVQAEPPVHERMRPWETPVPELELELQPLTAAQIEERLQEWQKILQREVRKRVRYDILLNNAEKLAETQKTRQAAAEAAGRSGDAVEDVSLDELKAELAEQSQAQQTIVRAIVARMDAAIRILKLRRGDPQQYVDYIAGATGQKLNVYDPSVLYAQVRAWLFAPDGGIRIALNLLKFVAILVAFWILSMILAWLTRKGLNRVPNTSSLLKPLVATTVKRTIVFIGLITAVSMLGVSVGPLVAMIGAAGLVVGLALQGTLSNFASGILILITRPFDMGDVIEAGGVLGKVEAMNLVSTRILTFDNQVMLVPNNQIWNGVITNITGRGTRRVDLTFGIGYADDVAKAMEILERAMKEHPKVLPDPPPMVRVSELGDNSVNLIARPWSNTADYWDVYWDLMQDVKRRFDEVGINIPFPQRDIHVPGPIEVVWSGPRPADSAAT